MKSRTILLIAIIIFLLGAVLGGVSAAQPSEKSVAVATLTNVRDFAPAVTPDGVDYAVDGGALFAGRGSDLLLLPTPAGLIVNAVAVSSQHTERVYIGAAN